MSTSERTIMAGAARPSTRPGHSSVCDPLAQKHSPCRMPTPSAMVAGSTMKSATRVMMEVQSSQVQSPRRVLGLRRGEVR